MSVLALPFPLRGYDANWSVSTQPPLTSSSLSNVRPYDVDQKRARGGQRPGMKKFLTWASNPELPIMAMVQLTVTSY